MQQNYEYYEVRVEFQIEIEKPNGEVAIKKQKEAYLTHALSCTEAEVNIINSLKNPNIEFEVTSVKQTKFIDVLKEEDVKEISNE